MKPFGITWSNFLNNTNRFKKKKFKRQVTEAAIKRCFKKFLFLSLQKIFQNCMQICLVNIHVTLLNKDFPWPLRGFSYFKKIVVIVSQLAVTAPECHSTSVNQFSIRSNHPEVFSRNSYSKSFPSFNRKIALKETFLLELVVKIKLIYWNGAPPTTMETKMG